MKIEDVRKLQQKKFRNELGHFLVEGEHPVQELLKAAARDERLLSSTLYCTRDYAQFTSTLPVQVVSPVQMAQISETRTPQGIVAVVPLLAPAAAQPDERAVYLHEIQDPGNLGTVLRTLAWFGGFRCLLGAGSVDMHNGKAVRASMGAIFHVPVEQDVELASLASRFPRIACLDMRGEPVTTPAFHEAQCYVYGNEARGLPDGTLALTGARAYTIAGVDHIESLNVASVVAICQFELHRTA